MPVLGSLLYRFSGTKDEPALSIADDHARRGNYRILKLAKPGNPVFNLMRFYESLLEVDGCRRVDLAAVSVYNNHGLSIGLQCMYRLTFKDGKTEIRSSGVYGGSVDDGRCIQIILEEGEYFTGLVLHRRTTALFDPLVKGITFVTNRRRVLVGGENGMDSLTNNPPDMKIIAFCGTLGNSAPFTGLRDVGFYLKPLGWKSRGTYILMRSLVRQNRSQISSSPFGINMQRLVDLDEGVFRMVMIFL